VRTNKLLAGRPGMRPILLATAIVLVGLIAIPLVRTMLAGKAASTVATQSKTVQRPDAATTVSLTFDDAYENQWSYAVPLLRSHHMSATFYVITADSDGPFPCCMSWAQLRILQGEGDDVGSHTVSHARLTQLTPARIRRQICASRQDMLRSGIDDPVSFAYPFGSFSVVDERIVAECGFTNARQGGGISSSNTTPGVPWAETFPPKDARAIRTIAPDGALPIQLPVLERYVVGAADHGGGWLPITFHDVCDVNADDFIHCMSTYGAVQERVLRRFLDWLGRAGQPGGAPAGVVVRTMRWAADTVRRPDTTSPTTTVLCDGSPCHAFYRGRVTVALSAADPGGVGVAKTYYFTADGTTPTRSSSVYQIPFIVRRTETIKFFSVDNAGNRERVKTITVRIG
jgi:peptidoglycan/xylan/chitin deacetylase (PgdA/CDA1 family)